ncbi:MAG: hypothetical protein EKK39_02035 [Sphingobacteriales bacterium]|nr:MAG: hypothetical protein EKK39_02035 [Sphingobacteriales bacterium]
MKKIRTNNKNWQIRVPYFEKPKDDEQLPQIIRLIHYLNAKYEFRKNTVSQLTEVKWKVDNAWREISDTAISSILIEANANNLGISKLTIENIISSGYINEYDPFKDYFESLPAWDGRDYIEQLSETIKSENQDLWKIYLKKWLVSMVRCAIYKGVTNQQMLVFYGDQGLGKTRWILKLLPDKLKPYFFMGYTNMEDQVFALKLSRNILIFLDELDSYKSNKQAIIKSTITQEKIKVRPLFNTYDIEVDRRASFIAAINQEAFLHDLTGSRRFLVVSCLEINHSHNVDMDKLFTQVYHLAKDKKFTHFFSKEEIKLIEEINERHRVKPQIEEVIEKYIEPANETDENTCIYSSGEIIAILYDKKKIKNKPSSNVLGEILKRKGFKRVSKNSGNDKRYGYLLKIKNLN